MTWQIRLTPKAEKDLKKLGVEESRRVVRYLRERVAQDPRATGKAVKGQLREFWRYRVGNYRILAKIQDKELLVLIVQVGHRSRIYPIR